MRLLKQLSTIYGKDFTHIDKSPSKGYRNSNFRVKTSSGETLNLIIYKSEPEIVKTINKTNIVSNLLAKKGFPVRTLIRTRKNKEIIQISKDEKTKFSSLYNYLDGETIPWEAYTMKHLKLLGWFMGDMHASCQSSAISYKLLLPYVFDEIKDKLSEMYEYFCNDGVVSALKNKINMHIDMDHFILLAHHIERIEEKLKHLKEDTILHMDLVRGNILFKSKIMSSRAKSRDQNPKSKREDILLSLKDETLKSKYFLEDLVLTGVIDFEKAALGHPVVDVARTLAFLIVDCKFKTEEEIRKYFLNSGYQKRGGGESFKIEVLNTLLVYFWLYDFYKFLLHNPYQFLERNEHFRRTRKILIAHKLIGWG